MHSVFFCYFFKYTYIYINISYIFVLSLRVAFWMMMNPLESYPRDKGLPMRRLFYIWCGGLVTQQGNGRPVRPRRWTLSPQRLTRDPSPRHIRAGGSSASLVNLWTQVYTQTHTHTHTQAAMGPPTGGSGTTHRWQWDRPQAAVGPPTGSSETAHRRQ